MFYVFLLSLASLAHADDSLVGKTIEISARSPESHSINYTGAPGQNSGCTITLGAPKKAKVVGITEEYLEVEWETGLNGCYLAQMASYLLPSRGSLTSTHGFLRKDDIIWDDGSDPEEPMPMIASIDPNKVNPAAPPKAPCVPTAPSTTDEKAQAIGLGNLERIMKQLRRASPGVKNPEEIDKFMECYPYKKDGLANYQRYKPFLQVAVENFRVDMRGQPLEVNPALFACLLRRESGYDPNEVSTEDAVGLGQHTSINITDISQRINKEGSWESALWKSFFKRVTSTREGRQLLAECPGTGKGKPVFDTRADARCPLQSIAASSIYNLVIQRDLLGVAKKEAISWTEDLDYHLAVGATYNLGQGHAKKAVKNLVVGGWVKAILKKSPTKDKKTEVAGHIAALRNCMQADNWKPMVAKDIPACEDFPGRRPVITRNASR